LIEGVVASASRPGGDTPVVWPNRGDGTSADFIGGKVFDPEPSVYENVVALDFSSMYPSIIHAFNIGPETWHEDPDAGDIAAPIGSFDAEPVSTISTAFRSLNDERNRYKHQKKAVERGSPDWYVADGYSRGLKAYVNSFYGVLGTGYSRLYNHKIASNITRAGRQMLEYTADAAEDHGHTVRYGDTDSVLIELGSGVDDPIDAGDRLAAALTEDVRDMLLTEYNADPTHVELELDEIYSEFLLTEKKKRYAGNLIYDGSPCNSFTRTGFKSARSDTPQAVREFQDELLQAKLNDEATTPIVSNYKDLLYSGEIDEQLVTEKTLTKPISAYDRIDPHVRVAKRRGDIGPSDVVPYIKYGTDKHAVAHPDELSTLSTFAYYYLWEALFGSVATALDIDISDA
jgi:DNA polymerase I